MSDPAAGAKKIDSANKLTSSQALIIQAYCLSVKEQPQVDFGKQPHLEIYQTQINAGRAYVRAQLAATAQGLAMQPLSQALQEYPEQAGPYARIHALLQAAPPAGTVQMWARLGHGPAIGPAPRRGLDAHLIKT